VSFAGSASFDGAASCEAAGPTIKSSEMVTAVASILFIVDLSRFLQCAGGVYMLP
jgi:hypothetical protein